MADFTSLYAAIAASGCGKAEQRFLRKHAVQRAVELLCKKEEVVQEKPDALDLWFAKGAPLNVEDKADINAEVNTDDREHLAMKLADLESSLSEWRSRSQSLEHEIEKQRMRAEDALGTLQRAYNSQLEKVRLSVEELTEKRVAAMAEQMSEKMSERMEKAFEAKLDKSLSNASEEIMKRGVAKGINLTAEIVRPILQQKRGNIFLDMFEDRIKQLQL